VLAVSSDALTLAGPMVARLGLHFPVLSDLQARVIYQYRMLNPLTNQAHMGYVLIDASGRLRARVIDPSFGTHSEAILQRVARWSATAASP
jgi:peroxiredoxin